MSALFDNYKEILLGGGNHGDIDLDTDNIRFICVDHTDDNPSTTTDEDLADILAGARVAESANLSSVTITDGSFDHANETLSSVSGDEFESLVYFKETGTDGTSGLICKIDSGTGLPFTPSGGDIEVRPNASGVFSL